MERNGAPSFNYFGSLLRACSQKVTTGVQGHTQKCSKDNKIDPKGVCMEPKGTTMEP